MTTTDKAVIITSEKPAGKPAEIKPAVIPADKSGSDKPAAVAENPANRPAGEEIYFTVQLSAVPKNKVQKQVRFKGIESFERIDSGERYKYTAGRFSEIDQAMAFRRTISKDHPDAFVIAIQNGKIIPLRDAVEAKKTRTDK